MPCNKQWASKKLAQEQDQAGKTMELTILDVHQMLAVVDHPHKDGYEVCQSNIIPCQH
jgi:GTP-binding protein EngB required for normal cell division